MVSTIGLLLAIIAGINAAWILLWTILAGAGMAGAKLSKKAGMDNENTDDNIEKGNSFLKDLLIKLSWRLALTLIGYLMYTFGGE